MCIGFGLLATTTLVASTRADSQTVHGMVRDQLDQTVAGALVILYDTSGFKIGQAPVDFDGRYVVEAPRPGRYYLRVLRIGYEPWKSPDFELTSAPYHLPIEVDQILVTLPPITVASKNRCESLPTDGAATAALWEAVSVALASNRWTMERRLYRFRTTITKRITDAFGELLEEEAGSVGGFSSWPFQSVDPDVLAERGFVQDAVGGPIYYGPDTEVLFSDSFLEQHCWGLATNDTASLVGLTFTPTTDRDVPDIEGVLWLEQESLELQNLEFLYTNLERWVPDGSAGGFYEFQRLPNNSWIMNRWQLRAPRPRTLPGNRFRRVVGGFAESTGVVTNVFTSAGDLIFQAQ